MNLQQALFSPRSVAVVGQSDDASKTAGRPLKFLRQMGYAGRIYPINPRRETVLGERAWPSLAALPEPPDHVYVVTPTEAAVAAVEECGRLGVKVVSVLADGFAEAGAAGVARETRLRDVCARSGLRIVGPSSLGVVDLRSKAMLTANAAFDEKDLPVGRIFAASHSGSLIGSLLTRGKARGIGFAGFVSVGNEVDLSLGEICEATLDDPDIDGYMLFLETMRHAASLRRFALAAAVRGKPVLAYKLGRSAAARELAVSHTGALAGEDDVADVFLSECGIARVDTLDALIEGLPLLARVPIPARGARRKRVGVVTTTAGGATMVVDPLASRGVTIEPASAATLARLATAGIEVKPARLVDLTVAGARYDTMKVALDILLAAPEFDLVLDSVSPVACGGRILDELEAGALVDRLGIAWAPSIALDTGVAAAPALPFAYPVAVKVLSAEIAHKTDVSGVVLGVANGDALMAAVRKICAAVAEHRPEERVARVLVQPMVTGVGEVLVGYRIDRDVGPLVMVAMGGVLTEIARDRSLRLAPVDVATAREMLGELRGLPLLSGYRGRPAGDLGALAQAIVALSQLANEPTIAEAEINPLIVRPAGAGVVAVDALVKLVG